MECRAGTIYLSASLEWMAGLYRFSFFWLRCSGCGTVEMVGGLVWLSFYFLHFAVSSFGGWMSVVGFVFHKSSFFGRFVVFSRDFVFYKLLICLICYRWYRQSRNLEDPEPLLEQTRLEHRKVDIETRIEQLESDVRSLKSDHVMVEDGAKKD